MPLFSIQAASSFKNPNERTPSQDPKKGASLGFGFDNGIKINEADVTKGPAWVPFSFFFPMLGRLTLTKGMCPRLDSKIRLIESIG